MHVVPPLPQSYVAWNKDNLRCRAAIVLPRHGTIVVMEACKLLSKRRGATRACAVLPAPAIALRLHETHGSSSLSRILKITLGQNMISILMMKEFIRKIGLFLAILCFPAAFLFIPYIYFDPFLIGAFFYYFVMVSK